MKQAKRDSIGHVGRRKEKREALNGHRERLREERRRRSKGRL